jgi:nicotinate phosphoribosyltransferase
LETLYLGCLARRSAIATSVRKTVEAAQGKAVLFFSARFDHWSVQEGDGYAAYIGGARGVSTDANALWWKNDGVGTIPHGLIAAYGGNTIKASLAFDKHMPKSTERIVLVDFDNNCVKTSLEIAKSLGKRLWGVRLDTAGNLQDQSIKSKEPSFGVCPELVWNVRKALNENGYPWVKIIVSGGFNEAKIREFVRLKVPFDAVGVGSFFFHDRIDFTADIVKVNGRPCAKVGRSYKENTLLVNV